MRSTIKRSFLFFVLLLGFLASRAQVTGTLEGDIVDSDTKEGLIGVNIVTPENVGTTTDEKGHFRLELPVGRQELHISYIGYESVVKVVKITEGSNPPIKIEMSWESVEFDEVVVSGSRYAKRASEEVISIEVIKPSLVENSNAIYLDDLANKVTGLSVADGQASIRAGSAWSYSIGSRVNIVMDGQSMLTPDRSSIKWNYLPMENIGQIEVMKGASSVLYGSSAMNGTITLQTIKPKSTPETKFVTYVGALDDYRNKTYRWWISPRITTGGYLSRAHKVSDRFEYVLGINANYSQLPYYEYNDYHARGNLYAKWTSKRDQRSNWGFHMNYSFFREHDFIFWQDDKNPLIPIDDVDYSYNAFNIDPFYVRYDKKDNKHLIQGRLVLFDPYDDDRIGGFTDVEYQFQKHWNNNWTVVAGVQQDVIQWFDDGIDPAYQAGFKWAIYAQAERKWDKLSITGGMRSEVFLLSDQVGAAYAFVKTNETKGTVQELPLPLMRFGLNYNIRKNSFLRFNIGQAFRLPSLIEYFVSYEWNGLSILANPDLRPEYGWTSEIGYRQDFQAKKIYKGSFDVAIFWQEYKDLIEFQPNLSSGVALTPENLPTARIAGYEVSLKQAFNCEHHSFNLELGYTYAFPVELSGIEGIEYRSVGKYIRDLFKYAGPVENTPRSVQREAILKYRNRHLLNIVAEYENDFLIVGLYGRYYSIIENGDFEFDSPTFSFIPGINEYYDAKYPEGDFVLDINFGVKINSHHTISLNVKNVTNREYMLRLAKIEPPRSFNWQYKFTF